MGKLDSRQCLARGDRLGCGPEPALKEYIPIEQLKSAADYRLGELGECLGEGAQSEGRGVAHDRMNEILKGLYVEKQNASSLKPVKKKK